MALFGGLGLILAVAALGYFRVALASHDPDVWHVDPLSVAPCKTPNCFFLAPEGQLSHPPDAISPVFGASAYEMAQIFEEFALAQRATERVAGAPEDLHMTFVQRTPRLQAPDYVSVRFFDLDQGQSSLAIFSRSRFGHSDLGVNAARIEAWIGGLASFATTPGVFGAAKGAGE